MSGSRPGKKKKSDRKPVDAEAVAAKRERRAKATDERQAGQRRGRRPRVLKEGRHVVRVRLEALGPTIAIIQGTNTDTGVDPLGLSQVGGIQHYYTEKLVR